ncbi:MAG: putative DNA modification/repair radical SAM protein [Clostridiaceae bacterium]|jgi:putative DNA modification/repair radical SAM protein|nr:putative DNA modification/repair radical SAM protein [Clostridiaceae bacterium]
MELGKSLTVSERLAVLADGAKYDVSCSSSGSDRGAKKGFLGKCNIAGICHSFTSDGRCVSLLKLLMTNYCEYDCVYCVNRRSNDIPRARLEPREICELVENFYRRNYIEGLFLSSAVEKSPDYTMQRLLETLILLRTEYKYRGYIHVKTIPGASAHLIDAAARYADRMSVNIELPSENSLKLLAPQKKREAITAPMKQLAVMTDAREPGRPAVKIPAGQTTQMIIGATPDTDGQIIRLSQALYGGFKMKRVYYSAYTPVNLNTSLPALPPDLRRENRLYQADWLLRFYNFKAEELLPTENDFALDIDPKTGWALMNLDKFPVEINSAPYEALLRVPGIGVRNAYRIMQARKFSTLTFDSLKKMRVVLPRAKYFITANGEYQGLFADDAEKIRACLTDGDKLLLEAKTARYEQISMFDTSVSIIYGEF